MLFMKETPRRHEVEAQKKQAQAQAAAVERPSVREMLAILVAAFKRSPALLMTVLGGVAFHFVLGAATFEQLWFVQERDFDLRKSLNSAVGWRLLAASRAICLVALGATFSCARLAWAGRCSCFGSC